MESSDLEAALSKNDSTKSTALAYHPTILDATAALMQV